MGQEKGSSNFNDIMTNPTFSGYNFSILPIIQYKHNEIPQFLPSAEYGKLFNVRSKILGFLDPKFCSLIITYFYFRKKTSV